MTAAPPIATLAEIVAPLSVGDFRGLLTRRAARHVAGGAADRFTGLFDWDAAVASLSDGTFRPADIRLYRNRKKVPSVFIRADPKERGRMVDEMLASDSSFILNQVERRVPAVGALCAALAEETGDHVGAAVVLSCGDGSALDQHFDPFDMIVLQVDGAKRWDVYADPVVNPVAGMATTGITPSDECVMSADLKTGDWLFVPAGHFHRCDTIDARSMHISLLFYPLSLHRITALTLRAMEADPADRAPLRFAPEDAAAGEAAIKRALIERIEAMSLADLGRLHRASSVGREKDEVGDTDAG